MPYFDTVKYCEITTRKHDTRYKGPVYEQCAEDQAHTRSILAQAIDAKKFHDADIIRCAKASHTAYQGEWYCLNGQDFQ